MNERHDLQMKLEALLLSNKATDQKISLLTIILNDYDVYKRPLELSTGDDTSDALLKTYAACLAVSGKAESTIKAYLYILNRFKESNSDLLRVTANDVRLYLAKEKMKPGGKSNSSLATERTYICAFYKWLADEEYIEKNPCLSVAAIKCANKIKTPFSTTEIERLKNACNNEKETALVYFLLSTGVRVNELITMRRNDVNFTTNEVRVVHGKGNKERVTYMSDVAAMHLKRYIDARDDEYPALFRSYRPEFSARGISEMLQNIGARAGVNECHPHKFRRTFATTLANRGVEVHKIKALLGHTDIQTTMTYIYTDNSSLGDVYRHAGL